MALCGSAIMRQEPFIVSGKNRGVSSVIIGYGRYFCGRTEKRSWVAQFTSNGRFPATYIFQMAECESAQMAIAYPGGFPTAFALRQPPHVAKFPFAQVVAAKRSLDYGFRVNGANGFCGFFVFLVQASSLHFAE